MGLFWVKRSGEVSSGRLEPWYQWGRMFSARGQDKGPEEGPKFEELVEGSPKGDEPGQPGTRAEQWRPLNTHLKIFFQCWDGTQVLPHARQVLNN